MASQPIGRIRSEGRSSRPITNPPIIVPAGMAAMSSPMVGAPPPRVRAYGAASASGTTVKPASQPKSTRVRSTGLPNTAATPSQVTSHGEVWLVLRGGAGRGRTPYARMPADRLKDSESRARARYGPSAATRHAAGQEAGDLAELGGVAPDHGAQRVLLRGQDIGQDRRPGRRERGAEQHGAEDQQAEPGERQPRQRHQGDQPGPGEIQGDHHLLTRHEVGQPGQDPPADHRGQVGQGVGRRGQERRPGPGVHHEGDGHLRELVARAGQRLGGPQRAELPDGEHIAVGNRLFAGLPVPAWPRCVRRPPGKRWVLSVVHDGSSLLLSAPRSGVRGVA